MGVVIPFENWIAGRAGGRDASAAAEELAVAVAARDANDRAVVLKAAAPLLARCRHRYGFVVMRSAVPAEPKAAAAALLLLSRGLRQIDAEFGQRRPHLTFGVYFGEPQLAWFEDGYSGATGLAVPLDTDATVLAQYVLARIRELPR